MFDDQDPSKGSPPTNLPLQPEDMLASVEDDSQNVSGGGVTSQPDALSAGLLKPKNSIPPPPPAVSSAGLSYSTKSPVLGKVLGVVIGIIVLGGIAFGVWWVYNRFFKPSQPVDLEITTTLPSISSTPVLPASTTTLPITSTTTLPTSTTPIFTGDTVDTDHDGLLDEEEKFYGTDPSKTDTDGDGLSDYDEIKIWTTDPNNPDSDGDSYKDGDEVKNGYNPKGAGKLFNVPTSTSASSTISTTSVKSSSTTSSGPTTTPSSTTSTSPSRL
jgi:hypothetical protein